MDTKYRLESILNKEGIEYRPVVGGNLLRHPFLKGYSLAYQYQSISNADIVNDLGIYVGNNQFVTEKDMEKLGAIINAC